MRPRDLEAFYATLRWKAAKESHNVLRQAFAWALLNGDMHGQANPALVARPDRRSCVDHDGTFGTDESVREKDIPSRHAVEKLLLDAEEREAWTWWLYLKLAATTGARPGEVCALRRKNFDFGRNTMTIEWSADKVSGAVKRPKSAWSIRTLSLPASFLRTIEPLLPDDRRLTSSPRTPVVEGARHFHAGMLDP